MRLSRNFTLSELCKSETATRKGIDNWPSSAEVSNLLILTKKILQPIRDKLGPVLVTSGYRSPALNKCIGGSTNSDHCKGLAADFEVLGMDNKALALWIKDNLTFKQLILEFYEDGKEDSGWVHCSFEMDNNKGEVLRATKDKKKTVYTEGLS